MLMNIRTDLEPQLRLRGFLAKSCFATFEGLVGTVSTPTDQPCCTTAIRTLVVGLATTCRPS